MSKCHIVGIHMSRLILILIYQNITPRKTVLTSHSNLAYIVSGHKILTWSINGAINLKLGKKSFD